MSEIPLLSTPAGEDARRERTRRRALRLEYATLAWTLLEATVGLSAAVAAGSVALLAFGVDSVIEVASAAILLWRLHAERTAPDAHAVTRLDRRAHRLVAASLVALALYVVADAATTLWRAEPPQPSPVGVALLAATIVVMYRLAGLKRRAAVELGSHALEADSFQTTACMWLSATALAGITLNALLGWWWADPLAALVMPLFLVQEARKAWRGEACSC